MEDLLNIIEKIFPVLIFIFWIVVSVIAGNRKKMKRQPVSTQSKSDRKDQQSQQTILMHEREHSSESMHKDSKGSDDLKRKLESVFGELTFDNEIDDEAYEMPAEKKEPYVPETMPEKVPLETDYTIAKKNKATEKKAYDLSQQKIYGDTVYKPSRMESELNTSIEGLRKAVILSEIIGPPLSLRNE